MKYEYFRQMNYQDAVYTLNVYSEEVGQFQEADLAFQANKYSRWTKEQKSGYIQSVILGKAPSKFIFADVEACLEAAIERGDKQDINYYKHYSDRGIKYLNIDSNNRNNVIVAFENNEVSIPHGKYDIQGSVVTVDETNDVYATIDEVLKEAFKSAFVTISVYTDATREELSQLFRNVNDGKPLNRPEKLNSYTTVVANVIRDLADKYGDYFVEQGKWFKGEEINRRGIDQFISHLAFLYAYDIKKPITNETIENFYRDGSDGEQQMSGFRKTFTAFMKDVMSKDAYAIANRNSVFDLFYIYCGMKDKNLKINDNNEFLKEYISVVGVLLKSKKLYDSPNWVDPKSFHKILGGTQKTNNILRNELIMENFDVEALTTKLHKKRTYTASEKMVLAVNGGFKTPEGKDIDLSKLHTNAYHGGHIEPHKTGGQTTIENGVIQTAEDNLKLGAKPLTV